MKKTCFFLVLLLLAQTLVATPPLPPKGYRWVLNVQFSDEFNGNALDRTKWNDTFGDWKGRPPALFIPEAITVGHGNLKIKSGVLDKPYENFTMYGGAVSSSTYQAHFGYYECRAKASKIAMSTTFWLSNQKVPFESSECKTDSYSQELDIQEGIGGGTVHPKFRNGMNSNTHFRYIKCGAEKEEFISLGTGKKLSSEVSEQFHTYGAWWKNANEVLFFADNTFFDIVNVRTDVSREPFDRPMKINMVTETYNWQPPPSQEDLLNDKINTAYYDWVRSYVLVPVDEEIEIRPYADIFEERIEILKLQKRQESTEISLTFSCLANADKKLMVKITNGAKVLQTLSHVVLAGYSHDEIVIPLSFEITSGNNYRIEIEGAGISTTAICKW